MAHEGVLRCGDGRDRVPPVVRGAPLQAAASQFHEAGFDGRLRAAVGRGPATDKAIGAAPRLWIVQRRTRRVVAREPVRTLQGQDAVGRPAAHMVECLQAQHQCGDGVGALPVRLVRIDVVEAAGYHRRDQGAHGLLARPHVVQAREQTGRLRHDLQLVVAPQRHRALAPAIADVARSTGYDRVAS